MAGLCVAPDTDLGLVQSLLGSVDCNVQTLAEAGYGALSRPGSPVSAALMILVTLYIAVMGFRLMIGRAPLRVGELTLSVLKIGLILTLATSWPTYQQVVFDVLIKGPEQMGATILRGVQSPGGGLADNPFAGLQVAYDQMQLGATYYSQRSAPAISPFQGGPGFAAFGLNMASLFLILTTLGTLLAAKIVLALLLGLGPIFIAFMLFDATRGLFEGWLRAAVGFAFVPLLAILGLVVQLTLLEPQLVRLAEIEGQKSLDTSAANAIFFLSATFAMVNLALLIAGGIIAISFRLPRRQDGVTAAAGASQTSVSVSPAQSTPSMASAGQRPDRAAHTAMAAAALERRDGRASNVVEAVHRLVLSPAGGARQDAPSRSNPAPSTLRRSAQPRRAASSLRRDR